MSKSPFKHGQKVCQIMPAPEEGHIIDIGIDKVDGERLFLVAWEDNDGQEHQGWYKEGEIMLSPNQDPPAPAPEPAPEEPPAP